MDTCHHYAALNVGYTSFRIFPRRFFIIDLTVEAHESIDPILKVFFDNYPEPFIISTGFQSDVGKKTTSISVKHDLANGLQVAT